MQRARSRPGLPRKGRPAAPGASPCPQRAALRERGEAAQPLRGVFHFNACSAAPPSKGVVRVLAWRSWANSPGSTGPAWLLQLLRT